METPVMSRRPWRQAKERGACPASGVVVKCRRVSRAASASSRLSRQMEGRPDGKTENGWAKLWRLGRDERAAAELGAGESSQLELDQR